MAQTIVQLKGAQKATRGENLMASDLNLAKMRRLND